MTHVTVASAVAAAFPNLRIDAVVAEGFSGREPWPEVAERLSRLEADAAAGRTLPVEDDPHIASWRAAYRAFGTNPKRERPSIEALRRRLARSAVLTREIRRGPHAHCGASCLRAVRPVTSSGRPLSIRLFRLDSLRAALGLPD
jgi:hypothetical protein